MTTNQLPQFSKAITQLMEQFDIQEMVVATKSKIGLMENHQCNLFAKVDRKDKITISPLMTAILKGITKIINEVQQQIRSEQN